jgi:type I restriction enzyme M protein
MTATGDTVQKLWSLSSVLRDDGMVYHQYMTELTYLLFLKIASETNTERALPQGFRWGDLIRVEGEDLLGFYRKMLTHLGEDAPNDKVRKIFAFPTTVFKHATNLRIVVDRINGLEWYSARRDGFGDIYEGLLEKNAVESKSGAGQYFTPRALVDSIVSLSKPRAGEVVQDPAAGTGGFLVRADRHARGVSRGAPALCQGMEIVKDTYRLCLMNLFLHGMDVKLINGDALSDDHQLLDPADVILTNPPFGARGTGGSPRRRDLPHPTSNKQLLFVQHVYRGLRDGGRAAVVVPDNVLFESNAAQRIRTDLMGECDLHTILRLPGGIFYSAGVKTNVLFFTRRQSAGDNSREVWIYDARTNVPAFGKRSPLMREFFAEFERCFGGDPHGRDRRSSGERWRSFSRKELSARGDNLDIRWLHEEGRLENELPEADEIAAEILSNLSMALTEVEALTHLLAAQEA